MAGDLQTFLQTFRPDGYTTFVAIVPDGSTRAATFNGTQPDHVAKWIGSMNRACNVYFQPNLTAPGMRKKPTKSDISAIAALWADVDPLDDAGRPWASERQRLATLGSELQEIPAPPTMTIDSGNGIQPLWCLAEPIEASPEYRDAAETLCSRIEHALGAKGTHNCDRLLRVPGTSNLPNAKKHALGRGETESRLLYATGVLYSWRDLQNLALGLERSPLKHAEPIKSPGPSGQNTGDLPPYPDRHEIDALLARDARLAELWGKTGRQSYANDASRWDQAFANQLAYLGLERERICAFLRAYRAKHDPDKGKQDRADYLWRTTDSAIAWATKRRAAQQPGARRAVAILRDWIVEHYLPLFREGQFLWSRTYGRLLRPAEIMPTVEAIDSLAAACDAPRDRDGLVKTHALPALSRTWIWPAITEVMAALPSEVDAPEICPAADARFRLRVDRLLATMVTISSGRGPDRQDERRSLRGWCEVLAKAEDWGQLRTYALWFQQGPDGLEIALRPDLAHQVGGNRELADLDFATFASLADRYGVGGRVSLKNDGNETVVLLSAEFLESSR
jgi:hypothetical protein